VAVSQGPPDLGWLAEPARRHATDGPRRCHHGRRPLAPTTAAELEPLQLALHDLTLREREVAQLLARGATNDEIARSLWISRHTVKDHAKAVYAKLGVASRAELSAKLFHQHIVPSLDGDRIRDFGRRESRA
jgi:DNA-binding CsgD family transcriptional regulator